ncbi:MAG TPA: DUF3501 family protein [Acidimicrobiales bacterium]|nr:DUF3501 family protein [Acidimicrobiales bacterium]
MSPFPHEDDPFGSRRLTLDDIYDLRAYEHLREEMRSRIIALKRRRRVAVGPIVSVVFENRETVRFQVQEMVRAERMLTDAQVQSELDAYNPLIPGPGELSATAFIELTDEAMLREWLPKLVGVEHHMALEIGDPAGGAERVRGEPEEEHEAALTRSDVTATVHYLRFRLTPALVERFALGPVCLAVDHPAYSASAELADATRDELLDDLRG